MASKLEEIMQDIEELKRIEQTVVRQRVKDIISLDIRKLETEVVKIRETESLQPISVSNPPRQTGTKCYDVKITNYAWDQSNKFVKIFVSLKNVQSLASDAVFCKFTSRSMLLQVLGLENRNYTLSIVNLFEAIDVSKSHWKVKTDDVVVYLAKASENKNWSNLTRTEVKSKEPKLPEMDTEGDPSAGLMSIMKKMYEEGDDEMKRTIAKAWTESREKGGNVMME